MIIRVFEGRLKPGREHEFMAGERELLSLTDVDGLLGVSIGRRLAGGAVHVITLTMWRDLAAIEQFARRDTARPVFLSGSEDLVDTWALHHYDAVDSPDTDPPSLDPTSARNG
jgi:heme-degrading monooxygenase HmoA